LRYRWYNRLLAPIIATKLRPRPLTQGEELRHEQREGPFAAFVNAFDGLPIAGRLRDVIDDALQPSALSRRIKGLVFAVVARGIGCPLSESEATQLLLEEGLPPAVIEHVLAHLSSSDLDPLEQAAVSLARESIWYKPAAIQRQVRSIRPLFTHTQFVELIGIGALANTICRLAVAVDVARRSGGSRLQA
jgi:alkylhydroperoxidase family enzyme